MSGLGQSILEEGREEGRKEGREEGRKEGREEGRKEGKEEGRKEGMQAFIMDKLEENAPKEHCIIKLQKHFGITQEKAEQFYDKYAAAVCILK